MLPYLEALASTPREGLEILPVLQSSLDSIKSVTGTLDRANMIFHLPAARGLSRLSISIVLFGTERSLGTKSKWQLMSQGLENIKTN